MILDASRASGRTVPKLGYVPALDGLRALAIAAVVSFHVFDWPPGGWLGVDLFFVLSGFLITTLLLQEHREHGRVAFGAFYRRRALRLLPALVAMLAVFVVVAAATGRLDAQALFGVAAGIAYVSNFAMAASDDGMPAALVHLWSLAAEEQFYVIWPVLLFALLRARVTVALVAVAAGIAVAMAQGMRLTLNNVDNLGFRPDVRALSILVGCALALAIAAGWRPRLARWEPAALAVVASLFVLGSHGGTERIMFSGPPLLLFCSACAVLIVRALDESSPIARLLAVRPLVFVGLISYSLYLWHVPVLHALESWSEAAWLGPLAIGASVTTATASYYFVEKPFLRRKRRLREAVPDVGDHGEAPPVSVGSIHRAEDIGMPTSVPSTLRP